MALYHFQVNQIKRSAGRRVSESAAYRAGEKLYSDYYGMTFDYSRKGGVVHKEILLPPNAPREYEDRTALWDAVENAEYTKKAQLAYSFDIALQNEFSAEENIALSCSSSIRSNRSWNPLCVPSMTASDSGMQTNGELPT